MRQGKKQPSITQVEDAIRKAAGNVTAVGPMALQWADGAPGGWVAVPDEEALVYSIRHVGESFGWFDIMDKMRGWTWDNIAGRIDDRLRAHD